MWTGKFTAIAWSETLSELHDRELLNIQVNGVLPPVDIKVHVSLNIFILHRLRNKFIEWLNGVLRRFQQYFSHITATAHIIHAFVGFTSTRLGSEVSCPRTLPRKNPEDPVRFEPRTPGLRVKHFTTEPRRTLNKFIQLVLISLDSASWKLYQYSRRMFGPMKIPKLRPAPGTRTRDFMIVRPTLYLTTTDTSFMLGVIFTDQTVRNRFHEDNIYARRPATGPILTARHQEVRLEFARHHITWLESCANLWFITKTGWN